MRTQSLKAMSSIKIAIIFVLFAVANGLKNKTRHEKCSTRVFEVHWNWVSLTNGYEAVELPNCTYFDLRCERKISQQSINSAAKHEITKFTYCLKAYTSTQRAVLVNIFPSSIVYTQNVA